jgi:hypothetical protein
LVFFVAKNTLEESMTGRDAHQKAQDVFGKGIFPNAMIKLILNWSWIADLVEQFYNTEFSGWQKRECRECTGDSLCKKHKALHRLENLESARRVYLNVDGFDEAPVVYMARSDLFVFMPEVDITEPGFCGTGIPMLLLDCPPLFTPTAEYPLTDEGVKKFTPFTVGDFFRPDKKGIELVEPDIDLFTSMRDAGSVSFVLNPPFGKEGDRSQLIIKQMSNRGADLNLTWSTRTFPRKDKK